MEFYTSVARKSNNILYRGIKDGEDVYQSVRFEPTLYCRCAQEKATHEDFFGGPVRERTFDTIYDMQKFIKTYGDIPGEIWGNKNPVPQFIYEKFGSTIEYNKNWIRGAYIDIEVLTREYVNGVWVDGGFPKAEEAKFPVNAICQYDTGRKRYSVFSLAKWSKEKSCFPELAKLVDYHYYENEKDLLQGWLSHNMKQYPHYITGWNNEKFDIVYLVNRVRNVIGDHAVNSMSPWETVELHEIKTKYGIEQTYSLYGIAILDYMNLYKKHIFVPRESYTLDFIAEAELGEHKKEFEGTHGSFFWEDPQGFQDYNIKDVALVVALDNKLQLCNLVFSLAYFAGINYEETFSPIRTWDTLIYRECMGRGIAPVCNTKPSAGEEYEGAYVFPARPGMYKSIASFDATSLYPSVNRSWNIGADTILNGLERELILNEIKEACISNNNTELANLCHSQIPFVEYFKDNGIPEYITEILKKHSVSLTLNWQLFNNKKESIVTYLQSKLFNDRKSDKKKAKEYAQEEKLIHQELVRRGLIKE